ncbi:MAG: metallophosphoesterase [Terrimicrobiaceae bacterium]|nr:metallophosphoesterase [Terrimicrobiaceae bacterium]
MKRRRFWGLAAGAAAGCLIPRREWAVAAEAGPLRVVFYTDVHAMPGLASETILSQTAESICADAPDVVIAGGDVIHRGHLSRAVDCPPRFALYRRFLGQLPPGVRHVVGNHDLAGARPEDRSAPEPDPWKLWREELEVPEPCQALDAGGVRFLILDTLTLDAADPAIYRGEAGPERLAWLRQQIAEAPPARSLILCTHIPLASSFLEERHPTPPPASLQTVDALAIKEAFASRRPIAILQGHLHFREETSWEGIPVVTAGAVSGAWWKGSNAGTPPGYARLDIRDGRMSWEYVATG